jgi:hypothetical protein
MPLDQSKFDQEQTKDMIGVVLEELGDLIPDNYVSTMDVYSRAVYAISHGWVQVGRERIPYKMVF